MTRRRTFLTYCSSSLTALGLGLAIPSDRIDAAATAPRARRREATTHPGDATAAGAARAPGGRTVADSWLSRLTGTHNLVLDVPRLATGGALTLAHNYLNAMHGAHAHPPGAVQVVLGLHGAAIGMAYQDEVWAKYRLGERLGVDDPTTKARALRNVWYDERDAASPLAPMRLKALQRRGMLVLLCGNVVRTWTHWLARETSQTPEVVQADLDAGLAPDAIVVPAMIAAFQQAQAAGCAYVYAPG